MALHKAKHDAVAERIKDVVATGQKVVVFTCFNEGITRHKKTWGDAAVTITGADSAEDRQEAVDRFQDDPAVRIALCNIVAGGVGITLTAGWLTDGRAHGHCLECLSLGGGRGWIVPPGIVVITP